MKLNRNIFLFFLVVVFPVYLYTQIPKPKPTPQITEEAVATSNPDIISDQSDSGYGIHIVQPNQNLHQIAHIYYNNPSAWQQIAQANNLDNPDIIQINQELTIPKYQPIGQILTGVSIKAILGDHYIIEPNDTLWHISERAYGTPFRYNQIAAFNNLSNPDHIQPGWILQIPRQIN